MKRIPPIDRVFDDHNIDATDDAEQCASPCRSLRIFQCGPERHNTQQQEKLQEQRSQSPVPDPPGSPGVHSPDGSGRQRQRGEPSSERCGHLYNNIGELHPPNQENGPGHRHQRKESQRNARDRHVHIEDTVCQPLLIILGHEQQRPGHSDQQAGDHCADEPRQPLTRQLIKPLGGAPFMKPGPIHLQVPKNSGEALYHGFCSPISVTL